MSSIEQLYEDLHPLFQAVPPSEAQRALENVVRSFPQFGRAHHDLAALCYHAGDRERALRHFRRAVECDPEDVAARKSLADVTHVELGQAAEALAHYREVIRLRPRDLPALKTAANLAVGLERFEEAEELFRRVLAIEPGNAEVQRLLEHLSKAAGGGNGRQTAEEIYAEAQRAAADGDESRARQRLEELVARHPQFAPAHNDLGVLCYRAGRKAEAIARYEEAVRLDPDNPTYRKNRADYRYVEEQRTEEALRDYVAVLEKNPEDVETLLTTAHICVSLERFEDARHFYERVLEIEPWNADARAILDKLARIAADQTADGAEERHAAAARQVDCGDLDGAIAGLERLVAAQPDYAVGHNDLGVLRARAGDFEAAQRHYEEAVRLDPANATFAKNLAELYWLKLGRFEEALRLYVEILGRDPQDLETLAALGKLCIALRQFDDARCFFDRILEIEPWNSGAHQALAELEELGRAA